MLETMFEGPGAALALLLCVPVLLVLISPEPIQGHEFTVYRMQQYNLQREKYGCRVCEAVLCVPQPFMASEPEALLSETLIPVYMAHEDSELLSLYEQKSASLALHSSAMLQVISMVTANGFQMVAGSDVQIKPISDSAIITLEEVQESRLSSLVHWLSSQSRAAQLLERDPGLLPTLELQLSRYLRQVQRHTFLTDKRDPDYVFFDQMKQTMTAYRQGSHSGSGFRTATAGQLNRLQGLDPRVCGSPANEKKLQTIPHNIESEPITVPFLPYKDSGSVAWRPAKAAMESKLQLVTLFLLQLFVIRDGLSFGIRNDHLGKCIQLIPGKGRVALAECSPESELQKWDWKASSQSLISLKTKECLTAARVKEHEMVRLQVCREGANQGWSCSKKGHLTLQGQGLHLSTKQGSSKVFLSKERGKTSKWRTMHNGTVCAEAAKPPTWKHEGPTERVQQPTLTLQSKSQHCSITHGESVIEYSPQ
ncbi:UNVERIFIED_CONTAM: hypothetical protein FKN15_059706 [Acipenser sinensis]